MPLFIPQSKDRTQQPVTPVKPPRGVRPFESDISFALAPQFTAPPAEPTGRAGFVEEGLLEDALYYLNYPWEQLIVRPYAELVGAKLNRTHGLYDQPTLSDVLSQQLHVSQDDVGTRFLLAGGEFLAAILLDPLNVLRVGSLTKLGKAAKGIEGLEEVTKLNIHASRARLLGRLRRAGITNKATVAKFLERHDRLYNEAKRAVDLVRKTGITRDASLAQAVAEGQRHLLSIDLSAHPVLRSVLKLAGLADHPITTNGIPLLPFQSAIAKGLEATGEGFRKLGFGVAKRFQGILRGVPWSERLTKVKRLLDNLEEAGEAEIANRVRNFYDTVANEVVSVEELDQIIKVLETTASDPKAQVLVKELRRYLDKNHLELSKRIAKNASDRASVEIKSFGDPKYTQQFLRPTRPVLEVRVGKGGKKTVYLRPDRNVGATVRPGALINAVERGEATHTFDSGIRGVKGFVKNDYVVLDVTDADPIVRKALKKQINVPGVIQYGTVMKKGRTYLVGNLAVGPVGEVEKIHLKNLEVLASLLAKKGYALSDDITLADFLFDKGGRVQFISPNKVEKVVAKGRRGIEAAADQNAKVLAKLYQRAGKGVPPSFPLLADVESVKRTQASRFIFRTVGEIKAPYVGDDIVLPMRTDELMGRVLNDHFDVPSVQQAANQYVDEHLVNRANPQFHPPVVTVDDEGNLIVLEGLERILAAHNQGLDEIPVVLREYLGPESTTAADDIARLPLHPREPGTVEDVFDATMPASKVEQYSTVRPLLSEDVRLLNDQFKPIQGKSRFVSEAVAVGQDFIRELNAALKSAGFKSAERLEILKDLKRELGRTENGKFSGAVFSLNLLDATPDQLSNTLNAVIPLTATGRGSALQTAFFKLVDRYGKRLRALEERMLDSGILTQRLADRILDQDADAIRRLAEKVGNRFLVVIDRSTGRLHIISGSRTVDELTRQLEILSRRANPVKGGYVFLHGTDGSVARRATEIFGKAQLIPGAPKKAPRLFATKRMKKKLAEANIFVNPEVPKEKISKAELTVRRATGRPFIWSSIGSSFVVTPSGELIVSAVHPSPSQLAKRLWGQGPWYVHEMGTVTKEGIVLSNVLGFPGFDRLDKTALQFLKKRLQKIAQRLDKAGFRRDTPMHIVLAGVPPEVRKELFGSHLTLGEMLSKEFDLRLPEEHLGIDLSGAVPVGVDALKDVPSRGTLSGAAQRVLKQIAASFDKNIFEEVRAGIPVQYRDGYYARILNPAIREDAKDLLDDMWMKFLKSDKAPKQLKQTWQRFGFTKRRYSDLTFEEINKLWQEAQADPLSFHKFGKAEKHPFIAALADYGLNIQEFFVADPRVAMLLRDIASAKALHSVKVMDELLNKVALVSGTVEEINQVSGLNKELRALSEQHEAISKEIEQLLNDMHGHPPDVQEVFQKRLEKLKTDRQRIAFKMAELSEKKAAVHPLAAVDADVAGQVVFSKKDARLLIDKNPTLADIIELDPDKPFAKLDTGKLSVLEGTGVRVGIFDKEVLQYLDGYFSKLSHSGPLEQFFRTFFDPLQRLWATAALFTMPKALRFVTRNVFSDVTRLWLAGVKADSMLEAWRLLGDEATKFLQLRDPFLLKKIREHVFVGNFGQSATFEELWGEFVNRGGISGGLFINEFAKGIPDDVWEKLIDNGVHPSMMALAPLAAQRGVRGSLAKVGKSILYKGGVRLTTATETINRFAAFLHYWKETGDIEKAMLGMKAVMYDYHNLTAFERQVVKRLIPFWAWMRNNIPFMAKMYVLEPVKLVQYRRAWEAIQKGAGGALTPEEIPPYLKNVWGVTVLRRYGKVYWMIQDNLLPQSDIVQLFNPGGWSDYLFQSLSPFAKIAYEVATGRSSLTGRELFLFASQPARSGTLSTLGATAGPTVHGPLGPFNLVWNELLSRHVPSFSALVRAVDSLTGKVTSRGDKLPPELLLLDLMLASVLVLQPGKLQALFEYRKRELTSKARQVLKQGIRHNNSLMQQWAREKLRQIYFTTDLYSLEGLPK